MYADDQDPTKLLPGDVFAPDVKLPTGTRVPLTLDDGTVIGYSSVAFDTATGEYVAYGTITDPAYAEKMGLTAGRAFSIPTETTTTEEPS